MGAMNTGTKEKVIPSVVEQNFLEEQKKFIASREWINFSNAHKNLFKISVKRSLPFDPKFNAVLWAFDVARLCNEITFSYCWMGRGGEGQVLNYKFPLLHQSIQRFA